MTYADILTLIEVNEACPIVKAKLVMFILLQLLFIPTFIMS